MPIIQYYHHQWRQSNRIESVANELKIQLGTRQIMGVLTCIWLLFGCFIFVTSLMRIEKCRVFTIRPNSQPCSFFSNHFDLVCLQENLLHFHMFSTKENIDIKNLLCLQVLLFHWSSIPNLGCCIQFVTVQCTCHVLKIEFICAISKSIKLFEILWKRSKDCCIWKSEKMQSTREEWVIQQTESIVVFSILLGW